VLEVGPVNRGDGLHSVLSERVAAANLISTVSRLHRPIDIGQNLVSALLPSLVRAAEMVDPFEQQTQDVSNRTTTPVALPGSQPELRQWTLWPSIRDLLPVGCNPH
jgi:hypothetical protein